MGNRWAIGIAISGFALLGLIITSQISEMQADIRELRQSQQSQQSEQPAERTGNSARPAQEGRISAANHSGS